MADRKRTLPPFAVFMDLETTGVRPVDVILEVGAILVRLDTLEEVSTFHSLVLADPYGLAAFVDAHGLDPVVVTLHDKSGLWRDLNVAEQRGGARLVGEVDEAFAGWLRTMTGSDEHVALGGSGVAHFDRPRFIDPYMPVTSKRLTYWALDTGVLRRTLQSADRTDLAPFHEVDQAAHRAFSDARDSLNEFRRYRAALAKPHRADDWPPVTRRKAGW